MSNTIVKLGKLLLSFILMSLSPFVIIAIIGVIYVIFQLINGLELTASISSSKAILLGLTPYFSYLTIIPAILILLAIILKKSEVRRKIKNLDSKTV